MGGVVGGDDHHARAQAGDIDDGHRVGALQRLLHERLPLLAGNLLVVVQGQEAREVVFEGVLAEVHLGRDVYRRVVLVGSVDVDEGDDRRDGRVEVAHLHPVDVACLGEVAEHVVGKDAVFIVSRCFHLVAERRLFLEGHVFLEGHEGVLVDAFPRHAVETLLLFRRSAALHFEAAVGSLFPEEVYLVEGYDAVAYLHVEGLGLILCVLYFLDEAGLEDDAGVLGMDSGMEDVLVGFTFLHVGVDEAHRHVVGQVAAPFREEYGEAEHHVLLFAHLHHGPDGPRHVARLVILHALVAVHHLGGHDGNGVTLRILRQHLLLRQGLPGIEQRVEARLTDADEVITRLVEILPGDIVLWSPAQHDAVAIGTRRQADS